VNEEGGKGQLGDERWLNRKQETKVLYAGSGERTPWATHLLSHEVSRDGKSLRKQMDLTCNHVTNVDGVLERVSPQAANEKTHISGSRTFHNPTSSGVALIGSGRSGPASSACWSTSETVFFVFSDG
jgi:hypothetical protein